MFYSLSPRAPSYQETAALQLQHPVRVSIHPDRIPAPSTEEGDVELYGQAVQFFGSLHADNRFTGPRNSFRAVQAEEFQVVSDARLKRDVRPLDGRRSLALLRALQPREYRMMGADATGGRLAAGMLAQEVPVEYTAPLLHHHTPPPHVVAAQDDTGPPLRSVDYNSLLAHLWNAVRGLDRRVTELEAAAAAAATDVSFGPSITREDKETQTT